jgi:hypothetical protein
MEGAQWANPHQALVKRRLARVLALQAGPLHVAECRVVVTEGRE